MKTFQSFTEEAKRKCPSDYKWSKKYKACVTKGKRWKNVGVRWGGHGHDKNHSGNGNGSHNGNGNGHGNGGNGNGGGGNGGGGNGGGE